MSASDLESLKLITDIKVSEAKNGKPNYYKPGYYHLPNSTHPGSCDGCTIDMKKVGTLIKQE